MIGLEASPFCIPIIAPGAAEVEAIVRAHGHEARFFEVWLDYLTDRSGDVVTRWASANPGRFVFHFRRRNLEPITAALTERQAIWRVLLERDVFIDLDGASQGSEIEFVRALNPRARGIVSFHDYMQTPTRAELRATVRRLHVQWPEAIVKVSTFCRSAAEAAAVIELERELSGEGIAHIVLGMGEAGRPTRIAGARGGNVMNFTPAAIEQSSAAGQIPLAEFRRILESAPVVD